MTYTPTDLAAIRERMEKASPGPWEWADWQEDDGSNKNTLQYVRPLKVDEKDFWGRPGWAWEKGRPIRVIGCQECGDTENPADRDFLVASREDIPALLDEVETLRATIAEMTKALKHIQTMGCKGCAKAASETLSLPAVQALKENHDPQTIAGRRSQRSLNEDRD